MYHFLYFVFEEMGNGASLSKCLDYIEHSLKLAAEIGSTAEELYGHVSACYVHYLQGDLQSSFDRLDQISAELRKVNMQTEEASEIATKMALIEHNRGDSVHAESLLHEVLENLHTSKTLLLQNIQNSPQHLFNNTYRWKMTLFQELRALKAMATILLRNQGGPSPKALLVDVYKKMISIGKEMDNQFVISETIFHLGELAGTAGQLNDAISYYQASWSLAAGAQKHFGQAAKRLMDDIRLKVVEIACAQGNYSILDNL
jgi:tetratricopeptide (TPR) repeat protein